MGASARPAAKIELSGRRDAQPSTAIVTLTVKFQVSIPVPSGETHEAPRGHPLRQRGPWTRWIAVAEVPGPWSNEPFSRSPAAASTSERQNRSA